MGLEIVSSLFRVREFLSWHRLGSAKGGSSGGSFHVVGKRGWKEESAGIQQGQVFKNKTNPNLWDLEFEFASGYEVF